MKKLILISALLLCSLVQTDSIALNDESVLVKKARLGVMLGAAVEKGALIQEVSPNSAAAKAGLKRGDIIIGISTEKPDQKVKKRKWTPIDNAEDLVNAIVFIKVGEPVLLRVVDYENSIFHHIVTMGSRWAISDTYAGPRCPDSYSAFTWHNCVGHRVWPGGEDYVGEFENGRRHGQGAFISADGQKYIGEYKGGKRHEQGTYTYASGSKYIGEFKDEVPHGQGTFTWADGNQYVGEYKVGKKDGQGTFTWADGDQYVGGFKDDLSHGIGHFYRTDGRKYIGEYRDGTRHGQGTLTWADGRKYIGEFKDDKQHQGTYTWADGGKYIGEFKDGKSHGIGNFYRTDGSIVGGKWVNDEFIEGYSGLSCSGDSALWSDCIGTLVLSEGSQFIGEFLNGNSFGEGTITFPDNRPMQFAVEPNDQIVFSSTNEAVAQAKPCDFLCKFEKGASASDLGMFVVYAEKCADNYWMERADSQAFVKALDGMIKRGISQGRVSKQAVNQAVNVAETMIATGQFTYEQQELCQGFTMLNSQFAQPKDRY